MTPSGKIARAILRLSILLFVALALGPALLMLVGSLTSEDGITSAAYRDVLMSARQWGLMRTSLTLATATALIALVLGAPAGLALARIRLPFKRSIALLFVVPLAIPPYVTAIAWTGLLGQRGALTRLMSFVFGLDGPPMDIYSVSGAVLVLSLCYFPVVTATTAMALMATDAQQEDAARLSAGWPRALFTITLRQAMPGILAGVTLVFALALGNFGVPSLLQVHVYPLEVFTKFSAFYDMPGATATALPLIFVSLAALFLFARLHSRQSVATLTGHRTPLSNLPLGKWRWAASALCVMVLSVSVVLPIGALIHESAGISAYKKALAVTWPVLVHTLLIGVASATLITAVAFPLAYISVRGKKWVGTFTAFATLSTFALPATIIGIGLIKMWNRPGLPGLVYGSSLILILACFARFMAIAHHGTAASISHIDKELEEAAAVSGVSWTRTVWSILFPLTWRTMLTVWVLSFIFSLGELGASVLICPPGFTTFTVRLYALMHYGMNELVAAMAVILIACVLLPLLLVAVLTPRWFRKSYAWHTVR